MLAYMLDEAEFLSPYGVRDVSRYHLENPMVMQLDGQEYRFDYEPGESTTDLFGGNSNWRGPIWMPGQLPHHSGPPRVLPVLRKLFPGRMPHRLGQHDDARTGCQRTCAPRCPHFSARRDGKRARVWRQPAVQQRPSLARPRFRSSSTSTATPAAAAALATKRAGPASSPKSS